MTLYQKLIRPETLAVLEKLHTEQPRHGETTPDDDMDVLASIIANSKAKRILQFGTFLGGSALVLADLARANGDGAKVLTIDPDPAMNATCNGYAKAAGLDGIIQTVDGFSTDPHLHSQLDHGEAWDAIYLDTIHSYQQTLDEITCIAPLCGPATLFLFHDASQFAADTLDQGHQGGVARAMREYCLMHPRWQWFVFEKPAFGQYGIGLMQKKVQP
jgi:predicted O-methyltransferase YrrM